MNAVAGSSRLRLRPHGGRCRHVDLRGSLRRRAGTSRAARWFDLDQVDEPPTPTRSVTAAWATCLRYCEGRRPRRYKLAAVVLARARRERRIAAERQAALGLEADGDSAGLQAGIVRTALGS